VTRKTREEMKAIAEKRDKIAEQSARISKLESALRGEAMSAEARYQLYTEMVERNNAQAARIAELEAACLRACTSHRQALAEKDARIKTLDGTLDMVVKQRNELEELLNGGLS